MSSESPKPVSVEDNHTDAKESETEAESKKDDTTNRGLQQACQVVIIPEKEKDVENIVSTESTKKTGYATKQKSRITKWLRESPIETKSVVINFWMAVFTLVMVFFTVILTAVSLWQAYIAQNALKASQDSVVVAKQALDEARKSGEEASRLNAQMLEANQRLAAAAQLQAEGVSKSVKVGSLTAQAAEKSAGIAQQALIASNRAFVSIDKMRFFKPLEADKPIDLIFEFANDGNNPAEVGGFTVTYISPSLRKCEYGPQPNIGKVVIAPKSPRTQRVNIAPNGISQQWIDAIKDCSSDGLCKRYIQVCIKTSYTTLGGEYKFEDCSYYSPGLNAFVACKK